ncbi:MAG TPA: hypothetical protein VKU80_03370 [Planctomycetota bacterium]|nr:hypothetical protein [Planctomycetota bacterium]
MWKSLPVGLCLLLSACGSLLPGYSSGSGAGASTGPTGMVTGTTTASAGVQGAAPTTTPVSTPDVPPTTASAAPTATKSVTFDTSKKLEYVDLYIDMGDPSGQRALVPYLMKPKDWMLIGCDMTSTSSKHYRFMRVSTTDGKELPEVDIFKQGR